MRITRKGTISTAKKLHISLDDNSSHSEESGHLSFKNHDFSDSYSFDGLSNFTLTSEYLEKDIVIDDVLMSAYKASKNMKVNGEENDITTIKIFKESGVDEIGPESLKQYIEKNTDIKKVVIEKVSLEEASRISLLFEPDKTKRDSRIVRARCLEEEASFDLSDLEDEVNFSFLNDQLSPRKRSEPSSSLRANLSLKQPENDAFINNEEFVTDAKFKPNANHTLAYEKHSLTRKRTKKSAGYYYRVKDHMELYKVGSSYLKDYQSGIRSMGFSSYNLTTEGAKTIFGITSFFNYHDDINVCIITNRLQGSFYASILEEFQMRKDVFVEEGVEYDLYHADGNDFIEFSEIINVKCQCNHTGPEDFIEFLLEKYDLILWDLPSLEFMNRSREIFFPVVQALESLTLIVGAEISRGKELDALISYYHKYQVPVKGVLFSDTKKSKRKKEVRSDLA